MTILAFIIVIVVLVLVHELGHFLSAKQAGIRVDEFGIGFPPRLWSIQKGETLYSINLIPFGGFVKIHGENGLEVDDTDPRAFSRAPRYRQALVLAAGVAFNFICAWVLLSAGYMIGLPASPDVDARAQNVQLTVTDVLPDSPAADAGLGVGDVIVSVVSQTEHAPETALGARDFIAEHGDAPLTVTFIHDGAVEVHTITPRILSGSDHPIIGIAMESIGVLRLPFMKAIYEGAQTTVHISELTVTGFGRLIADMINGRADMTSVTGPVGIASLAGNALHIGFANFIAFTALISIQLAILNLLPIPALDGGRIVILGLEAIRNRPIPVRITHTLNTLSFFALVALMLVVTYRDIMHLF